MQQQVCVWGGGVEDGLWDPQEMWAGEREPLSGNVL